MACRSSCSVWIYAMPTMGASPLNPALGAAERACEPGARAASAPGWQPPVRRRGRGASPGAGGGHRPPNPAARGPSWAPRVHPGPHPAQPSSLLDPGGERRPISPPLAPLIAQLVLCSLLLPHRALGAPSPRCTWWRPRYAQKNLVRACASSPEIPRGGHGIMPALITTYYLLLTTYYLLVTSGRIPK
jgi:hypothetical protein